MITKEEIKHISNLTRLKDITVEKDYVLGWLLAGISQNAKIEDSWVFKGGTCLRKCFYENYRFSEDLDFTIKDPKKATVEYIRDSIREIAEWVQHNSGITIDLERTLFEVVENTSSQTIIQGRLFYRGPISPSSPRQWPRIKFDLTPNEVIVEAPVLRPILNTSYSDYEEISQLKIFSYSLTDLFAEKIRALFERTRPRDLYDVVEIYNRSHQDIDMKNLRQSLKNKCLYKRIDNLDINSLYKDQCMAGWIDQLSHQLPMLPDFDTYFTSFETIYAKIGIQSALE